MPRILTTAQRVIVAADFEPPDDSCANPMWIHAQVMGLAHELAGTGVILKVNSALRVGGYDLIARIHGLGLGVFADLKYYDIPATLRTDGKFLRAYRPEIVTVACDAGIEPMHALKEMLQDSEVIGITVLTSTTADEIKKAYDCGLEDLALMRANSAASATLDGLVCSAKEAPVMNRAFNDLFSLNTPAIRPEWARVAGDDQNKARVTTPAEAIKLGSSRIVVGRPILNPPQGVSRREAALRTVAEVEQALAA